MSGVQQPTGKIAAKRATIARVRERPPVARNDPRGYVAMHEVNAAMCLSGGILAPRFEASAARDHHLAGGGIQIELNAPSAQAFAGARGGLPYGNLVVFEVPQPGVGQPPPSLPLWHATRLVFESPEALQLFRARMSGYGDVPDEVLPMLVDATLFAAQDTPAQPSLLATGTAAAESTSDVKQACVAPDGGAQVFREIDRCAGGLLAALSTTHGSAGAVRLIESLDGLAFCMPSVSRVEQFALTIARRVDTSPDAAELESVLTATVSVLASGEMDDGFSTKSLCREAEQVSSGSLRYGLPQCQTIQKFWAFTRDVIELRREVPEGFWSDEGRSAIARGTLLFMLNPEPEQLQAVRERTPSLGTVVHFIAGLLVGIRAGLTRMGREMKSARGPFLAGAAFVHDWLRGQDVSLALQRTWDTADGSRKCSLVYEGTAVAEVEEPADSLRVALATACRAAGAESRFSPDTGGLFGKLGVGGWEFAFDAVESMLPTFPRQAAIEVGVLLPGKLSRSRAVALVANVNAGTREHCVSAQVVEEPAGRKSVRLSVLVLKTQPAQPLKEPMTALVAKASELAPIAPVKAPRPADNVKRASRSKTRADDQPAS